jgi:hypothetical protein
MNVLPVEVPLQHCEKVTNWMTCVDWTPLYFWTNIGVIVFIAALFISDIIWQIKNK